MRIIAGTYRSRRLKSLPGDATRPTTDKIKEAIFSRIGPYFDGGVMLDLFGGSGNIGLEAISRGMSQVVFCDQSAKAMQIIRENSQTLDVVGQCIYLKMDYRNALQDCVQKKRQFDFIYLDPPYKKQRISEILTFIAKYQLVREDGSVICESLKDDTFEEEYEDLKKVKEMTYGITRITYYERRKADD